MRFVALFLAALAFGFFAPVPRAHGATTATLKLCQPSGTTVSYSAACPAGTTSVQKICSSGAIVPYSKTCPAATIPLTYGGNAVGVKNCQSLHTNTAASVAIGARYKVVGFWGYWPSGEVPPAGEPHGGVVLNDATHVGDGAFAIFVLVDCVSGAS